MAEHIDKAKLYEAVAEREDEYRKALIDEYREALLSEENYNTHTALQMQGLLNATTLVKYLIADFPRADVIPVWWIEEQIDSGKWCELVNRWREWRG